MLVFELLLILTTALIEAESIESGYLDLFAIPDYLDMKLNPRKSTNKVRENFLKKKKQRKILQHFDNLISNNTINVDGISHLEVIPDWRKAQDMENDYKSLIRMINVKYVYQRDAHWRTWRQIKDSQGKKQIICYKCQSKILPNCTDCTTSGVWVIEEAMPPCPYEIFSVVNSNEVCASNYTQLGEDLKPCPSILKYTDLTKSCNNPIITRWRFTKDYKVSERTWTSVICGGREFCEIITLYQIRPEYVIFRVINATDKDIIYSRIMRVNKENFACVNDCGVIDLKTYKVTKNKEKSTILNLLQTQMLPKKSKRNSIKNYIRTIDLDPPNRNAIHDVDISIEKKKNISRKNLYAASTSNFLTTKSMIYFKSSKTGRHRNHSTLGAIRNASSLSHKWVKTAEGYFIEEMTTVEATTQSHCKKLIDKKKKNDQTNTFDDYDEDIEGQDVLY